MLVGKPKSVVIDFKHYRKIRALARKNHLKLYEVLHEIVDQHIARMDRLKELSRGEKEGLICDHRPS